MKTKNRNLSLLAILFILLSSTTIFTSCKDNEDDLPELSQQEKDMLIQMREEEKLARDVYDYLFIRYDLTIFDNISNSEQKHMDKVLTLLNLYDITDPALPNPGEFTSSMLQDLYDQLITQGDISEVEALKVGATIEDVDIYDLEEFMLLTDNQLILNTFDKLNCGSRNHMRGFFGQLTSQGVTYEAQFITSAELDAIIDNAHESCGGGH